MREKHGAWQRSKLWRSGFALLLFLALAVGATPWAFAAEAEKNYYLGEAVNAGKDDGFAESNVIGKKDPHYSWQLGRYVVSGYTSTAEDSKGSPVFLKSVGDEVSLSFLLEQDIDKLNGDEKLEIAEDKKGYDEYFQVPETNFQRGAMIVRQTDYQNAKGEPTIYTNFLAANSSETADTKTLLFEEGDYEVALNYSIKKTHVGIASWDAINTYTDYRIFFRFSVRNSNCMVYPFDVKTKNELTNEASTPNGFYLDLAKSRYLDISIVKEVLAEGANGLTEDVRFNRATKDGDKYTDEGIYTITVRNQYTGKQTEKKIFVGSDEAYQAYQGTAAPVVNLDVKTAQAQTSEEEAIQPDPAAAAQGPEQSFWQQYSTPIVIAATVVVIAILVLLFFANRARQARKMEKRRLKAEHKNAKLQAKQAKKEGRLK